MSDGIDFGALGSKNASTGPSKKTQSVSSPSKPRTDWKKKFEELKKDHDTVADDYERVIENRNALLIRIDELEGPIADEMDMLRQQEAQGKQSMDLMSKQLEKFKFRPQQYSQILNIMNCLQINTNPRQKARLKELLNIGEEDHIGIYDIRDAVTDLLEEPYK